MPQFLSFTTAGMRFAVPLEQTNKVVPLVSLKPVPKADMCVAGMMNLGGVSVPVIDLAIRLDMPDRGSYTAATSIMVCLRDDQMFGLVADRINGVDTVADGGLELVGVLRSETMPYMGVYRTRLGEQTLVLDLDRVLDLSCPVAPPPDMELADPAPAPSGVA